MYFTVFGIQKNNNRIPATFLLLQAYEIAFKIFFPVDAVFDLKVLIYRNQYVQPTIRL